jgi:hypothetical protein
LFRLNPQGEEPWRLSSSNFLFVLGKRIRIFFEGVKESVAERSGAERTRAAGKK